MHSKRYIRCHSLTTLSLLPTYPSTSPYLPPRPTPLPRYKAELRTFAAQDGKEVLLKELEKLGELLKEYRAMHYQRY